MEKKFKLGVAILALAGVSLTGLIIIFTLQDSPNETSPEDLIIDHNDAHLEDFVNIPLSAINDAKNNLHIAYFHTSHGSQLTTGMTPLDTFMDDNDIYEFSSDGSAGTLHLFEPDDDDGYPYDNRDLTGYTDQFDDTTRSFLSSNPSYNVIMWSWCALDKSETAINQYLSNMNQLEQEYPNKLFIYMTAHLEGTGLEGDLHNYNQLIREYCINNDKILYDFADIESYDPDDVGYLERLANDNCDYDSDDNGSLDSNWAINWQTTHSEDTYSNGGAWFSCSPAHSQALNGNLKAYGAWYLFARLGGWDGN